MADELKRYFLDNDGDGHWYIIPVEKAPEWNKWLGDMCLYAEKPWDYVREPDMPEGLVSLGCSPTCVTFTGYSIELF